METSIATCKIEGQWEFALWFRALKPELCHHLEGWDGEGGGREAKEGADISIPMADSS